MTRISCAFYIVLACTAFHVNAGQAVIDIHKTDSDIHNNKYHYQGWVPRELIPHETMRELVPPVCHGTYFSFTDDNAQLKPDHVYITGDSAAIDSDGVTQLSGSIKIYTVDGKLFADKAEVNESTGIVMAEGHIRLYYRNLYFFGDNFWLNSHTGEMRMDGVDFVAPESRQKFQISMLVRDTEGVFYLDKASYSTCEPDSQAWRIYGSDITLDYEEGWGTIVHAILYVGKIPVFYFPWFRFPLDNRRHTGLLIPEVVFSNEGGWYYQQPIYLNLAPNYDATLYPRYYNERGLLVDAEARLLTEYSYNRLIGSGINDAITERWRSHRGFYHTGGVNLPFRSRVDYTEVTDALYYQDLNTSLLDSSGNFLQQLADIDTGYKSLSFRLGSYDLQPIGVNVTTGYARLPEAEVRWSDRFGLALMEVSSLYSNLEPRRHTEFTLSEITDGKKVSAQRRHDTVKVGISWNPSYGFVRGQLLLYNTHYQLKNQLKDVDDVLDRQVQASTIDLGLYFDRSVNVAGAAYFQSLEPRLFMLHANYVDQNDIPSFEASEPRFNYDSLFRSNRFQGIDRIGDAQDISYSVTTRLKNDKGYEFFWFGIGQTYYGASRKVTLQADDDATRDSIRYTRDVSPIATRAKITLGRRMNLTSDYVFDHELKQSLLNQWNFQHRWSLRTLYNLGYNYSFNETSKDIANEQAYVSGVAQATVHWAVFGRYYYNLKTYYAQESILGFEYESCCWRVRAGAFQKNESADDPEPSIGFFIQFHLKGLSGSEASEGESYDSDLTEGLGKAIPGFNNRTLYLPD